ncbi:MAG: hypothetical protein ABJK37_10460 [Paraglaciecola sp.]
MNQLVGKIRRNRNGLSLTMREDNVSFPSPLVAAVSKDIKL